MIVRLNPSIITIVSLSLLSSAAFAMDASTGWYAGAIGGGSSATHDSSDFTYDNTIGHGISNLAIPSLTASVNNKFGGDSGGKLGYRYNNFRGELEFLRNTNKVNSITIDGITYPTAGTIFNNNVGIGNSTSFYGGLMNAYYEFITKDDGSKSGFTPYLGIGFGYGRTDKFGYSESGIANDNLTQSVNNNGVAYQGIIGLNYFVDNEISFGLDYRHLSAPSAINSSSINNTFSINNRLQLNTINATFSYAFDAAD